MNRGSIRTLTAELCGDPNQTMYSGTSYNDSIEKAQQQFAMDSKALYKDFGITMVVDTASYALPTDFMYEKKVLLNGIELEPVSRATLETLKSADRWDDDKGTPRYYVINPEEAQKTLTLYPKPDSVADGTSIVLTYYPFPAAMTSDTDIPLNSSSLMLQFHTALASYAAWLLLMYQTQTAELIAKRRDLIGVYSAKISEAIQTFGDTKSEPMSFHPKNIRAR